MLAYVGLIYIQSSRLASNQAWLYIPLILAEAGGFKASLVYLESSRTARAT